MSSLLKEEITTFMAEVAKEQQKAMERNKEKFQSLAKRIFISCPNLAMISWTQFTPYFNDGDTCEFTVHEPTFVSKLNLANFKKENYSGAEDLDEELESICPYELEEANDFGYAARKNENGYSNHFTEEEKELLQEFGNLMRSVEMEKAMEDCFGDHTHNFILRDPNDENLLITKTFEHEHE